MKKLLKIIAGLILTLIIIFVAIAVIATNFVDPNSFKPVIEEKVLESTGKKLNIDGQLAWSFFPTLGISTGKIILQNPPGFEEENLLLVDQAKLSVKVLPMFVGKIELGDVVLKGLEVHLVKQTDGTTNWAMKAEGKEQSAAPVAQTESTDSSGGGFSLASIPAVDVEDVHLTWNDYQSGDSFALKNLSLQLKQSSMSSAFPVTMSFDVLAKKPSLEGHVSFDTLLTANIDDEYFHADDLDLSANLKGGFFSGNEVALKTSGSLTVDGQKKMVELKDGKITLNDLVAKADFYGNQSKNTFNGHFNLESFNLRQLLSEMGLDEPKLRSDKTLTNIAGAIAVKGTNNSVAFNELELTLDESVLKGDINITSIEKNVGTFAINLNKINLDNYMPEGTGSAPEKQQQQSNTKPEKITFDANMNGTVDVGQIIINQLTMQDLHATITAKQNYLSVDPMSAKLYEGTIGAKMTMDSNPTLPKYTADINLNKVNIKDLVKDTTSKSLLRVFFSDVTGIANMQNTIATQGLEPTTIKRNLNGHGNIAIENGKLEGIDLAYFWKLAQSFISSGGKGTGDTKQEGANETEFGSLTATYTITNGLVKNSDFLMQTPSFRATGHGEADIPGNTINYHVLVSSQNSHTNDDGTRSYEETGDPLPLLKITGTLDDPSISLDAGELIKSIAKDSVNKLGDTLKESVGGVIKGFGF